MGWTAVSFASLFVLFGQPTAYLVAVAHFLAGVLVATFRTPAAIRVAYLAPVAPMVIAEWLCRANVVSVNKLLFPLVVSSGICMLVALGAVVHHRSDLTLDHAVFCLGSAFVFPALGWH